MDADRPAQVADEYGTEAYRGSIDLTMHDPSGKEIHHANAVQDDELQVDAHGVKVGHQQQCADSFVAAVLQQLPPGTRALCRESDCAWSDGSCPWDCAVWSEILWIGQPDYWHGAALQGPWKLCFKVHRGGSYRPPSLLLEMSYFTVNHRSLVRPLLRDRYKKPRHASEHHLYQF